MYFTTSQAASACSAPSGTPMMPSAICPTPYVSDASSGTGNGAVAYGRSGAPSSMNATRHSPSRFMATRPDWKSCAAENSSPAPATNRCRFSMP